MQIGNSTGQHSALTLLKSGVNTATQTKQGQQAGNTAAPEESLLKHLDPEVAEKLQKKLVESRELLQKLQSSRSDLNEQRKAAAQEKVDKIKEKLKTLRLLAAVNPEAAARQAKQLSRELAAAVKEYAGASGGMGNLTNSATGTGTKELSQTTSLSTSAMQNATTASGAANTEAKKATTEPSLALQKNAAQSTATSNREAAGSLSETTAETTAQTASEAPSSLSSELRQIEQSAQDENEENKDGNNNGDDQAADPREAIQAQMGEAAKSFAESREKQGFADSVNEVKNGLKSIIETIKKKLKDDQDQDPLATQDIDDAEDALRETQSALNGLLSGGIAGIEGGAASSAISILI